MEKGNLLEPFVKSHQDKYGSTEPLLNKNTRLNGPVGCKIQSTFCWPCSVPQEKGELLSNSQRHHLLTQVCSHWRRLLFLSCPMVS